jgi:hypothetical protein
MPNLMITRQMPGVSLVSTTDPFSTLLVHRIERDSWKRTPNAPGIYLLFGYVDGRPVAYVGMSTTSIRDRIRSHHVSPRKNWFGTIFAIPLGSPVLCAPVEAEMIRRISEASVVGMVDNSAHPAAMLDTDDVHVEPAVEAITEALEILLGSDIFSREDEDEDNTPVVVQDRVARGARDTAHGAAEARQRTPTDPTDATHTWVGGGVVAWGRFAADEPDSRFVVLAGSEFCEPIVNPEHVHYTSEIRNATVQQNLEDYGVLDPATHTFKQDHVFDSWTKAAGIISGHFQYSGAYHWQPLLP